MLSSAHRLRHDKDFDLVFSKGRKTFLSPFSVRVRRNDRDVSRFAVVVGGKVSKKAVERNRLRRQVREIIRLRLAEVVVGRDVLVSVQKEAKSLSSAELARLLLLVFKKAGLLV